MNDIHDDPLEVKTDYAATLRASIVSLINSHCRRTGESHRETWHHLYARMTEVCGFDPDDYKQVHKLKGTKLDAVEHAGYLDLLRSLAEQLD